MKRRHLVVASLAGAAALAAGGAYVALRRQAPRPVFRTDLPTLRREMLAYFRAYRGDADVVMLGDSLTEQGDWEKWIPGAMNRGLPGDTTSDVLARVDEVAARHPKVVYVMAGVNDLRVHEQPAAVAGRVMQIGDALRTAGARVVIESVLPVAARTNDPPNSDIVTLNDELRRASAARGFDFLDLHRLYVKDGEMLPGATKDGMHLVADGYTPWRSAVEQARPR